MLLFNVGVETGQVAFVIAVVGVLGLLRRLPVPEIPGAWRVAPYAIGAVAAFWTLDRVSLSVQRGGLS